MIGWNPELQQKWKALLEEPPGLICIDFDNSFIRGDFGEQVMEHLLRRGYPHFMSPSLYEELFRDSHLARSIHKEAVASAHGNLTIEWRDFVFREYDFVRNSQGLGASYRWSSFIFSGWKESKFRELSRSIWLENLRGYQASPVTYQTYPLPSPMMVHPREPLLELIREFRAKSWKVKIVTASPTVAVEEATPELGLERSDVLGMNLEYEDSISTHRIIEPYPYGEGKVAAIEMYLHSVCDIAFGDTINDYPMLLSAKRQAVLFDRGYQELNQAALENGIEVHPWI